MRTMTAEGLPSLSVLACIVFRFDAPSGDESLEHVEHLMFPISAHMFFFHVARRLSSKR